MDTIRRYPMFIGGDWVDADERFEIRSPATEELVASVAKGGIGHADRAIGAAKAAHADGRWRRTPPQERAAILDFFTVYKALEPGKGVRDTAWADRAAAEAEVEASRRRLQAT